MLESLFLISLPFWGACLGGILALKIGRLGSQWQPLLLAFSGSFLLAITFFELLPKVYLGFDFEPGYWIIAGIVIQIGLEYFSRGVEHGHAHISSARTFPYLMGLSLGIHAFIEGIPSAEFPHLSLGLAVHKIPIAIALYGLWIRNPSLTEKSFYSALLVFSLLTPLGSVVGFFLKGQQILFLSVTAVVIGMLLHIATTILFETNEGHRIQGSKMLVILLGFFVGSLM
ncbi:MAG: ZIP family metal transporter [Flavobacteriaceae bacterium]